MTLSTPVTRKPVHDRQISCHGYLRDDGLWDIEAKLIDVKHHPLITAQRGTIPTGEKVHHLWLRLTFDHHLKVHFAEANTEIGPFSTCREVNPWYKTLVGMSIKPGWTKKVKQMFAGKRGCTHLTELLPVIATTAIQTIYPYLDMRHEVEPSDARQLSSLLHNSCHSFNTEGEMVRQFWPESYTGD